MQEKTSKEAREAKNAYMRKWRKEHPDNVRAINNRYWEKKASVSQTEQDRAC